MLSESREYMKNYFANRKRLKDTVLVRSIAIKNNEDPEHRVEAFLIQKTRIQNNLRNMKFRGKR